MTRAEIEADERVFAYAGMRESGCWEWLGSRSGGYGQITVRRKNHRAHRLIYELLVGPIPAGKQLDHLCRNSACVNPEHLEPVTSRENTLRGVGVTAINKRRTHCHRGHPFTAENTYRRPEGRYCKACRRLRYTLIARPCEHCGEIFQQRRSCMRFCSPKCRYDCKNAKRGRA